MHTPNLKTTSKYSFILSDRGLIVLLYSLFLTHTPNTYSPTLRPHRHNHHGLILVWTLYCGCDRSFV